MRKLLKLKNYDLHAVTTRHGDRCNANIVAWIMQTSRIPVLITLALEKSDFTLSLIEQSGLLVINLLSTAQTRLIRRFGQISGHARDKIRPGDLAFLPSGAPYLPASIGYIECQTEHFADSGDHRLVVARPLTQKVLHPNAEVLTYQRVRELGLIRG